MQHPETPNHAPQRAAPAVTLAASAAALPPAMQPARQPPPLLSLGSLGVARASCERRQSHSDLIRKQCL